MQYTVLELAKLVQAEVEGDVTAIITGVGGLEDAEPNHISFLANLKYAKNAKLSKAGAILLSLNEARPNDSVTILRVENPSKAFAVLCALWLPPQVKRSEGVHVGAHVSAGAKLAKSVTVEAGAVIEEGVEVGEGTIIGANVYLGREIKIGADCRIHPNVTIYERCLIGNQVLIHSGAVIGADGFGFDLSTENAEKIPQVGIVKIDDRVEIGANTTIDRARFGQTWIQEGVKIDNLVQVGHNVVIGKNTIVVAQTGISGSVKLGQRVILAGQVGMVGHIHIGDGAVVTAQAGVSKDVPPGSIVAGYHAQPLRILQKQEAALRRLPEWFKRIMQLEEKLEALLKKITLTGL